MSGRRVLPDIIAPYIASCAAIRCDRRHQRRIRSERQTLFDDISALRPAACAIAYAGGRRRPARSGKTATS